MISDTDAIQKSEKLTARQIRQAQQKSLSFHSKRLCLHSDWDYIRSHEEEFPFQREAEPAKESILALKNNPSYSQSGIIQSYGRENFGDDICSCCAGVFASGRTRTWKGCVSFPTDLTYPDRPDGSIPFLGQCANCHWGSQGWKCSLRIGGGKSCYKSRGTVKLTSCQVKVPPRCQRADLFQSSVFKHTHLGNKHDMDTIQGCVDARNELQGIINQVARRITDLEKNRDVEPIGEENARYDEDDDDVSASPMSSRSIAQVTPTPRTRPNGHSHTPRTPKTPHTTRPSSRNVAVSIEDDDDSDYVGPPSSQTVSTTKRRTRQSSRFPSPQPSSRIEVVIPPFRGSRHRSSRRSTSRREEHRWT